MIIKKITSEFKKRFAEELKRSSIDGKERYIPLCIDERKKLVIGVNTCIGTECMVPEEMIECPRGTIKQGDFHTHPFMKDIRENPELREFLRQKYGHIPPDEIILQHLKNINELRRKYGYSLPSQHDIAIAMENKCIDNINYTSCVGTDIMPDVVNCLEVEKDISNEDCEKATEELTIFSKGIERAEEWTRKYFKAEKIDISKYYKK